MMKGIALVLLGTLLSLSAGAQIPVTASSLTYTQDFNTLDSTGTSQSAMPAGWSFYEWGGTSANTTYRAGTGSSATGDTYSFGATNSRERALGALCSSGMPSVNYGVRFVNNTTAYINAMTISFKQEQWRRGGTGNTDSVRFYYSVAPGKTIADTSFSQWYQVSALLMTSVTTALPASAVNGNDTAKVITAVIPLALPAGDTILLRWYDYNSGGSDDGLAIDSLTVAFAIGSPSALYQPAISNLSPAPGATNVSAPTNLTITFDRKVAKGFSGNIYIKDRAAQTTQTISVASSNVTVSGRVATVSGVGLQPGKAYYVTFDSTVFDTAGFHPAGLYDTTGWQFSTINVGISGPVLSATLPVTVVNPAGDGTFIVRCTLIQTADVTIRIYDPGGREAARQIFRAAKGDNQFLLHTALPGGTYIIYADDGRRWGIVKAALQ